MMGTTMGNTAAEAGQEKLQKLLGFLFHDADNRALRSQCVEMALQQRNYQVAMELAEHVLQKNADDLQARFERASALMGLRDFDQAIGELEQIRSHQGDQVDPAVLQNLGLCYYVKSDYAAARPLLEAVYALGVRGPDLFRILISTLHHLGAMPEALSVAEQAGEAGRQDGALAGVLALLYLDADDAAQAARWSSRALAANPDSLDGLVTQATLRAAAFDLKTAEQQFQRALALAPQTGRAWVGMSLVSLISNDLPKAKSEIDRGLQFMSGHIGSWHLLAWIELLTGQLDSAQAAFERALAMNHNFAESHGGLAAIAAMRGERDKAQHLAEIAERLDANCLSARFARSVLERGSGNIDAAQNMLFGALQGLSPKDNGALSKMIANITQVKK